MPAEGGVKLGLSARKESFQQNAKSVNSNDRGPVQFLVLDAAGGSVLEGFYGFYAPT
jgi:hypothetical protein